MSKFRLVAALVAYDGTDYFGFQYQANKKSIQGELENALSKFCSYSGRVVGAGRTDSGVHARGQVIAVKVEWKHELQALLRAWNVNLPPSIVICAICDVGEGFHPRFSALSRTYCYYVTNNLDLSLRDLQRSPLTDRTSLYVNLPLDIEAMNQAAHTLIGIHDFAAFGQPTQGETTLRELLVAEWRVQEPTAPELKWSRIQRPVFTITANGFLRHMVRNIVGTLLLVGSHRIEADAIQKILLSKDRSASGAPVPPYGLVLEKVQYPPEFGVDFL
ncbi:MAG: tRNA pseudouridine(38-40) synthase TruA [Caldilineaceae bacterium]